MRVLAFDPGFERLGVAVVEKINSKEMLVHSQCLRTAASLPFAERLGTLGAAAEALIKKYKPDAVAIEDVYFAKNEKTAMRVAQVSGMLCYLAAAKGVPLFTYTPLQIKVAITGYGRSDKAAVAHMVARLVTLPKKATSTGLSVNRLDDEVDAIAVALTHLACAR